MQGSLDFRVSTESLAPPSVWVSPVLASWLVLKATVLMCWTDLGSSRLEEKGIL